MSTVKALKELLNKYPDDTTVEFHDNTFNRRCPINSHSVASRKGDDTILLLHNTLPRTFGL